MGAKATAGVESARRVLQILLMFGEDRLEITVDDVAQHHRISQPSAYRYISLLRELNLVQEGRHGGFVLTQRVHTLAQAAEHSIDLERAARPVLEELVRRTQETAFVQKRVRDESHFVLSAQPDRALRLSFRADNTMPLNRGAVAKVLLAFAPRPFRQNYVHGIAGDEASREALTRELEGIRANRFAASEGEVDEGIWGGAVPIESHGTVVAALSIAGPASRFDQSKREQVKHLLLGAAEEISMRMESTETGSE